MIPKVRRALVTGADGFLGRHLVRELERYGVRVTGLTRRARPDSRFIAMGSAPWPVDCLAQILDMADPDVVFHLAGGAAGSRAELEQLNLGLARTLMAALSRGQARPVLVCCGSAAEYGSAHIDGVPTPETARCAPESAYGASKLTQTKEALAFGEQSGTRVLIARIFNPIGPGMPPYLALGEFARQITALPPHGGVLQTGNLTASRDFIDVEDVASALHRLATHPLARGVVNICSGKLTRLDGLVELLITASGKPVRIELDPARLRGPERSSISGDPTLLHHLVGALPPTDDRAVIARIWAHAHAGLPEPALA
jgi:GDP-4-dehydro-6-deoxy-D-mannose reductase